VSTWFRLTSNLVFIPQVSEALQWPQFNRIRKRNVAISAHFLQEELDLAMADLKKYIQEFMQKFLGKMKGVRRVRKKILQISRTDVASFSKLLKRWSGAVAS